MPATVDNTVRKQEIMYTARFMIFGVLATLVLLAVFEYRAKSASNTTAERWRSELENRGKAGEKLLQSELTPFIKGEPTVNDVPLSSDSKPEGLEFVNQLKAYVWNGAFSTYIVNVYFSLGNDPEVEAIHGPGPPPSADDEEDSAPAEGDAAAEEGADEKVVE